MSNRNKKFVKTENNNTVAKQPHPLALLFILMSCTSLIIYGKYIFGNSYWIFTDIGSDTWNDYFPVLTMLAEKVRSGDFSTWVMNWGTGIDLVNNQSIICDPFNIPLVLIYIVGGKWAMAAGLVYVNIAKCLLTGYFTYLWLSEFDLEWYGCVIGAYVCAFNGFLILWGQHYFFATACVFMILDIYQLERTLKDQKKSVWLIISVALTLCSSLYTAFPIALACLVYLILREFYCVKIWTVKKIVKKFILIVLDVIIAVMISGIVSFPAYYQLTEVSSRTGGHTTVPVFYDIQTVKAIFTRLFSNNIFGVANNYVGPLNYYEMSQLFFSCLAPTMLLVLFIEKITYDKKRWLYVILAVLTSIMMFLPLGGAICNRFVNIATRYSYIYIPLMAFSIAWFISKFNKIHYGTRIIGSCSTVLFAIMLSLIYYVDSRPLVNDRKIISIYLAIVVICMLILALFLVVKSNSEKVRISIVSMISIMIVFSVVTDSALTCLKRTNIQSDGDARINIENTESAVNRITYNTKDLVRIEKTYNDGFYNDPLLEDYCGISYYNTTFSKYVQSFMTEVWPATENIYGNPGYVTYNADAENSSMATLMGIKYVLSKVPMSENYRLNGTTVEGINIYENSNSDGIGRLFVNTISQDEFLSMPQENRQNILENTLVIDGKIDKYADKNSIGKRSSAIKITKGKNSSHMKADLDLDSEGFLFVPVTWDRGWTATINGKKAQIYRADLGFQALKLRAGENKIRLNYESPLQKQGAIATLVGFFILIMISCMKRRIIIND